MQSKIFNIALLSLFATTSAICSIISTHAENPETTTPVYSVALSTLDLPKLFNEWDKRVSDLSTKLLNKTHENTDLTNEIELKKQKPNQVIFSHTKQGWFPSRYVARDDR